MHRAQFLAALVLPLSLALSLSATGPAAADITDVDVAACTLTGAANPVTPPPGLAPQYTVYDAVVVLDCVVAGSGDEGGQWVIESRIVAPNDTCLAGFGDGFVLGGSSQYDGDVTGGSFVYARAGVVVQVAGTIVTSLESAPHTLIAEIGVSGSLGCPSGGPLSLSGVATLADTVSVPRVSAGAAACTVAGIEHYGVPVSVTNLTSGPVDLLLAMTCIGTDPQSGSWNIAANGGATANCGVESGTAYGSGGAPSGAATASFTWVRAGTAMQLIGSFSTSTSQVMIATTQWLPQNVGDCLGAGATTATFVGFGPMVGT